MNEKFLIKPYIDHYIQAQILQELSTSENAIRFSDLKEPGMDNSLFMYHANKLQDRGLLEKVESGFQLTPKGARWINHSDNGLFSQALLPRSLIQFVINKDQKILLGKRIGSMKKYLNEYLLPGGLHIYGKTANESAEIIISKILKNDNPDIKLVSFAEYIIEYPDYTHHSLAHIFKVEVNNPETNEQSDYQSEWVEIAEINQQNPKFKDDNLMFEVIDRLPNIKPREVIHIRQD